MIALLEASIVMYLLYHVNLTHLSLQQRLGDSGILIFRVLSTHKKLVQLREEEGALCVCWYSYCYSRTLLFWTIKSVLNCEGSLFP